KLADCIEALAIMRTVGDVQQTATDDEIARDWGVTFLQVVASSSGLLALDMSDQAQRWQAFAKLDAVDPLENARAQGGKSAARKMIVLEDENTHERFVRSGWFQMYVRQQSTSVSPQELGVRMERVGWYRRGGRGQIKATEPKLGKSLAHRFFVVPEGW